MQLTSPLSVSRSVRIECNLAAALVAPLVPPAWPRSWDSGGGNRGASTAGAPGANTAASAQNASVAGALTDACVLDGLGSSRIIDIPSSAPSGLRVNITGLVLRNGAATGATPSGGALAVQSRNALVIVDHVTFVGNEADADGGAVWLRANNALIALGCRFTDNVRCVCAACYMRVLRLLTTRRAGGRRHRRRHRGVQR